jgi:hypothetical protein
MGGETNSILGAGYPMLGEEKPIEGDEKPMLGALAEKFGGTVAGGAS